jgi:hypothetical protein
MVSLNVSARWQLNAPLMGMVHSLVYTFLMKQIQLFVLRIAYFVFTQYAIHDASWLLRPSQQEWDFSCGRFANAKHRACKCQPNFPEK